jgi:hypothetical protein
MNDSDGRSLWERPSFFVGREWVGAEEAGNPGTFCGALAAKKQKKKI